MKTLVRKVSEGPRIALPPEAAEALQVECGDYVQFAVRDGEVRLFKIQIPQRR